jgi:hypothetical protein
VKGRIMTRGDQNIAKNLINMLMIFIGLIWGIYLIYISLFIERTAWRKGILYILGLIDIIVCLVVIFYLIKGKRDKELKPRN